MQALSNGQKMRINARKFLEYLLFLRPFIWNQKRKYGGVESVMFDPTQKAALDYADAVTKYDRGVNDQLFVELPKYYDDDTIIELTDLIAFQNLSRKFNSALDMPAQGFCQLPPMHQP